MPKNVKIWFSLYTNFQLTSREFYSPLITFVILYFKKLEDGTKWKDYTNFARSKW